MRKNKIIILLLTLTILGSQTFAQQQLKIEKPFSDAMKAANLLFISGQLGVNTIDQEKNSFRDEVGNAIKNVETILNKDGLTLKDVVSVTVYLKDLHQFDIFNEIYVQHFTYPFPTRSCVVVKELVKHANIEISVVAQSHNLFESDAHYKPKL